MSGSQKSVRRVIAVATNVSLTGYIGRGWNGLVAP